MTEDFTFGSAEHSDESECQDLLAQAGDPFAEFRDLEALRRLKARYCLGIDRQDWRLWREEVFAPDASLSVPALDRPITGVEPIISWVSAQWTDIVSVHHAHLPDLEIQSAGKARGRWAMDDRLYRRPAPDQPLQLLLHGFGYYDETYVRLAAGWRIQSTVLTRIHVEYAG